ncbi:MAG TPA: hypothetical protein VMV26_18805 [Alphaproteobacteria bacterium]|jgi:hypothetical protein|nr:hypothetical protein [Alphaproteobacteria bacterium]
MGIESAGGGDERGGWMSPGSEVATPPGPAEGWLPPRTAKRVLSRERAEFLAYLATRIVPESAALGRVERRRFMLIARFALGNRPAFERFQVRLFLWIVQWLPAFVTLRSFEGLPLPWQDAILRLLENAPLALIRAGFWGLKTVIFMGYYGQAAIAARIRYEPSFHGNEKLR